MKTINIKNMKRRLSSDLSKLKIGEKLYSPIFGDVYFEGYGNLLLNVSIREGSKILQYQSFLKDGRFYVTGEVLLFKIVEEIPEESDILSFADGDLLADSKGGFFFYCKPNNVDCTRKSPSYFYAGITETNQIIKGKINNPSCWRNTLEGCRLVTDDEYYEVLQLLSNLGFYWSETNHQLMEKPKDKDILVVGKDVFIYKSDSVDGIDYHACLNKYGVLTKNKTLAVNLDQCRPAEDIDKIKLLEVLINDL
jgi:hypothetical protein